MTQEKRAESSHKLKFDPATEFLRLGWNQDSSILPKPRGRRYSIPDMYIKDLDDERAYRVEELLFRGYDIVESSRKATSMI